MSADAITITSLILTIRGQRVMLDADLAALYGVATGHLNRATKRNPDRFPSDFMFHLTEKECAFLRCQNWHLNTTQAVVANVEIMRAFIRLRQMALAFDELSKKLSELEQKYDAQFQAIINAIRDLMTPPDPPQRQSASNKPFPLWKSLTSYDNIKP